MGTAENLEALFVSCKNCSSQVPTGLQLSGAIYEIPPDRGHEITCPHCGTTASYTKVEFHISAS